MTDSYSDQEYMNRIYSIGVPILSGATVYASISVIYLRNVLTPETVLETLLAPLQEVADQMAKELAACSYNSVLNEPNLDFPPGC